MSSDDMTFDQFRDEARCTLMHECCLDWPRLQAVHEASVGSGLVCVHLATRGRYNYMGVYKGTKKLFKHVFLQNPTFRNEVVKYYKGLGYDWVDVLPLNRVDWKIFLWYNPRSSSSRHQNQSRQKQDQKRHGEWPASDNQVAWRLGMGLDAGAGCSTDRPGAPSTAIPGDVADVDSFFVPIAPEANAESSNEFESAQETFPVDTERGLTEDGDSV